MKKRVHILSSVNAANISLSADGKHILVKDVCCAVDGIVMNGALYPANELAAGAASLEGRPAPAGHPKNKDGQYISALNGDALITSYMGSICTNVRHEGGRTLTDILVNIAQANAHEDGKKVVQRCMSAINGENVGPIDVSTGLLSLMINADGESNGKRYSRIATKINYDHLAILLNERGAGRPADGVGMFLNSDGQEENVEVGVLNAEDVDTAKAEESLKAAIELHEKHMNGTAPTTGADGEKSQMKMMRMMKAALEYLTGKGAEGGSNSKDKPKAKAKGMGGMKMNADNEPADHRSDGFMKWLHKRLGNSSELSFDQISSGLHALLPRDAWIREVYDRYCIWSDGQGNNYRQDYSVVSDGSVAFVGQAVEVARKVEYEPINNCQEVDQVKDKIVAALNGAGIKTDGLTDDQILSAYNQLTVKPIEDKLVAANSQIATFEANAKAAKDAEIKTLADELAVNSVLSADDLAKLGLDRLKELKANKGAAPILAASGATKGESEFKGYSINSHLTEGA